jgi:hypothetical protein
MSSGDNGVSYSLSLRCDRPIEGCELSPNPFLQQKGLSIDPTGRARLLDNNAYYYSFSWKRGPKRPACANLGCPRGHSFEPIMWSKAAIGGPELVCNVCTNAGIPGYDSTFCSKR